MPEKVVCTQTDKRLSRKKKSFSVGIVTPVSPNSKNTSLILKLIEPICELDFQMYVLALGDEKTQEFYFNFSERYPDNFHVLESIPKNKEKVLSESHVVLFPEVPDIDMLRLLSQKGALPLLPRRKSEMNLVDFDSLKEVGNCFIYDDNFWKLLSTLLRAYETFKFPYDWSNCQKNMKEMLKQEY